MPRKILHLDLDAFFCSVEEQFNPSLLGKAFAVGGRPEERGVVASCSYAARRFGVRSAMPMSRALRLCPELIIISSRHGVYSQFSRQVMRHLEDLTPHVEQVSIDEAFLDVTDVDKDPFEIALQLQTAIHKRPGLPCSIGAATNKLLAKIANDVGKASRSRAAAQPEPPRAITVVPPGQEGSFLAPLPVEALSGIGPKTAERLLQMHLRTIGDLATFPPAELERLFGKAGMEISERARGIDDRPVVSSREVKSISQETTFAKDISEQSDLRLTLRELSEGVGKRLRHADMAGTTVRIKIRWPDFTTLTRQITLEQPVDLDNDIYAVAYDLFQNTWKPGQPVRLLGVGVSGLTSPVRQLNLWEQTGDKDRRLQVAIDDLRKRFGEEAIHRGRQKGD